MLGAVAAMQQHCSYFVRYIHFCLRNGRRESYRCVDSVVHVCVHVTYFQGSTTVKQGLAQMLKGGIIMDVTNAEQAKIAENAGACAVMALERVPADIRKEGGVARMSDPKVNNGIGLHIIIVHDLEPR